MQPREIYEFVKDLTRYRSDTLIVWRNPHIRLKDGSLSAGKRILIDAQQRITALMAALLGREVLNKEYNAVRIYIAFNPKEQRFEVTNHAIRKNPESISDISTIFDPACSLFQPAESYFIKNPHMPKDVVYGAIENLQKIINNYVAIIELAENLDIETVTEIFIRVNSADTELFQANFVMSKIAVNESYGGNILRKAIDYFCHLAVAPDFADIIKKTEPIFAESELFAAMHWMKKSHDNIYEPTYTDMLRVAFTSEFGRGKLQDVVALLSGRNFETQQYEEEIAEDSFRRLQKGILAFINETHFERFTMILRSAGFIKPDLMGSQNAVNFAYILYLRGRSEGVAPGDLERLVRRWYVMSILTSRYTGSPETAFDFDIRQLTTRGVQNYVDSVIAVELPSTFWTGMLPQLMDISSSNSPYFFAYQAAQVKQGDKGFLSAHITVLDLLLNRSDKHHVYPQQYLKRLGMSRGQYNQIANFVISQTEINIAIADKSPAQYFEEIADQCRNGKILYGNITNITEMQANFRMHCLPESLLAGDIPSYDRFLEIRRVLMAEKIRRWF